MLVQPSQASSLCARLMEMSAKYRIGQKFCSDFCITSYGKTMNFLASSISFFFFYTAGRRAISFLQPASSVPFNLCSLSVEVTCMGVCSVAKSCPILWDPMDCGHQASLYMGFFREERWSWLPCPPPGNLLDPRIERAWLTSPALAGGFFTRWDTWKAQKAHITCQSYWKFQNKNTN